MNNITDTYCSLKDPGPGTVLIQLSEKMTAVHLQAVGEKISRKTVSGQSVFRAVFFFKKTFSPDPCVLNALSSLLESPQIKDESLQ